MSLIKTSAFVSTIALIGKVSAHGIVTGVIADGKYFRGYDPSFQYQQNPPKVAGWTAPLTVNRGFVDPSGYSSPDIICHKGATPGEDYIRVSAGGTIELQWTVWPESHHGPMLDYLAPCGDDCTSVDKSSLQWTKIDEAGMNEWVTQPGDWASDDMIRNNNSWVTTIPSSIAPGKYVLRHETIALHAANNQGGAQNYPQCMNIEISGGGTNGLSSGIVGTELYKATDPGVFVNIYYPKLDSYTIPGPPIMSGGSSGGPQTSASASTSSSSSIPGDISVTATPTTGLAIPSGEPALPSTSALHPFAGNSSYNGNAPASSSHVWADWTYATSFTAIPSVNVAVPENPTDTPADAAAPSPFPTSGSDSGSGADEGDYPSPPAGGSGSGEGPSPPTYGGSAAELSSPEPESPAPSTTSPPVSFSSTITGRIGKPTKFVCYVEED